MPKEPRPLHDLHPLRLLPLALCLAMVVFCIIRGGFSVEDILSYAPRNVWLAAGFRCCSTSPNASAWLFPSSFYRLPPGICLPLRRRWRSMF